MNLSTTARTKSNNIFDFFPHDEYRTYQRETIKAIDKAYEDNYKHIIVEGPCGSGKSAVAVTLGNYYANAYLLTSQKILQSQYINDYGSYGMAELKGRGNYRCAFIESTCDSGKCIIAGKCPNINSCPYNTARLTAQVSQIALLNYTYFLYATTKAASFADRDIIIYDEAHNIDKELMSFVEINFSAKYLSSLGNIVEIPLYKTTTEYIEWLEFISKKLTNILGDNSAEIKYIIETYKNTDIPRDKEERAIKLNNMNKRLDKQISKIARFNSTVDEVEWVFDLKRQKQRVDDKISFKPLEVPIFAKKFFFPYANKHFYMSATILDKDNFCKNIGIDVDEAKFFRVNSTFPVENRPIFLTNCGKMNMKELPETRPKIIKHINHILSEFPNEKGLIYTHTYSLLQYITDNSDRKFSNRLMPHDSKNRETVYSMFLRSSLPKVLVSPSMTEGIDLKDDLARFVIIVKVPYGFLGDPQIKRRMEKDPGWYNWKTATTLVQVTGRGVRHKDDYCSIYILDSGARWFFRSNISFFPQYFLNAIKVLKSFG